MKIEKIKKMNNGKYKIVFDDKTVYNTYDDVILKNNLLYNKNIGPDVYNQLNTDTNYYNLYNKAIKFISLRIRSEKEIMNYLKKAIDDEETIIKIINALKNINLINDDNFTKAYISDKFRLSNHGPIKIFNDLKMHDISNEIIESNLEKITDEEIDEKLNKIIEKKIQNSKYSSYVLKQKIVNELTNLGYDKDLILNKLQTFKVENNAILKDYDKTFNKLKQKYDGDELNRKIRQKLYQKGYLSDEINHIMTKKSELI